MQKGMRTVLRPYFELTNAVRIGDLKLFRNVADEFASTFSSDMTPNLIDHANGWMVPKETGDVYEPQYAFNLRIAFCLNMHNEVVCALRFSPNSHKELHIAEENFLQIHKGKCRKEEGETISNAHMPAFVKLLP
ncbi:hypothetical protein MKW98_023136 [Papaver atlanticum]|uniref:26S proteasome non-ATPase regulatory subunit 3 C-terminal domain-containing protein n=1 Tax=Papaver atlanticum TaxID=357466 RepID=A0AAD4XT74_9MAGN|nr:hypothetical protein MKW98_023136 [Papaver atlanticum]